MPTPRPFQAWPSVVLACVVALLLTSSLAPLARADSPLSWSAPFLIAHQSPSSQIPMVAVSCPSSGLCVAVDHSGNVVTSTSPTGGAGSWTASNIDGTNQLSAVSCPSTSFCAAVDHAGNVVTSTNPTGGPGDWTVANVISEGFLVSISCPSTLLCVALDGLGNVLTSTNPTGGTAAWQLALFDGEEGENGPSAVSCPTTSLCVAVDRAGNVVTSTNPTGGSGTWTTANVGAEGFTAIACPSASLCVSADSAGNVVTSTNPTGGAKAWSKAAKVDTTGLTSIACPSTTLCVASDGGSVVTSTNPTGGSAAWTRAGVDGAAGPSGISCPSTSLCVEVGPSGNVETATEPTGGSGAWTRTSRADPTNVLNAVSCVGTGMCVAVDQNGNVVTSSNPSGGSTAWTVANVSASFNDVSGVSCPTTSLCVASIANGGTLTSTNPTAGSGAWSTTANSGGNDVACPSTSLCVEVGSIGHIETSTNPTGGIGAWSGITVPGDDRLAGVSCPSTTLCVAVDQNFGDILTSTNPTGGASAWSSVNVGGQHTDVSCPSASLCVAVGNGSAVLTSTNPTGGASAWTTTNIGGVDLRGVSCPSTAFCVAVDSQGSAFVSTNPTGGAEAWSPTPVDGYGLNGVFCSTTSFCVAVDPRGRAVTGIPVAQAPDFTWSGGGGGGSAGWSNGANWLGGVAPTNGSSLGMVGFPKLATATNSNNDLSGLSLERLVINNTHGASLTGNALTLGSGGLSLTADERPSAFSTRITNPLTLAASQTWNVSAPPPVAPSFAPDSIALQGQLLGEGANLTINLSNYVELDLGTADDEIGNVTVNGTDTVLPGSGLVLKSFLGLSGLNGSDGKTLTANDVQVLGAGPTGPITVNGGAVEMFGSGIGSVTATGSRVNVNGSVAGLALDATSELDAFIETEGSTPGTNYQQLTSTGAISLGGAALALSGYTAGEATCPPAPVGRVYTLISTTGGLSGSFGNAPDGSTVTNECESEASGSPVVERIYAFRINYNRSSSPATVTATVLPEIEPPPAKKVEPPPGGGQNPGNPLVTDGGDGAVTGGGQLVPISRTQLLTSLKRQLRPSGQSAKIGNLLKRGGLTMPFTALEAGTLTVQWYEVPPGAKLAKKAKPRPVLVASGRQSFLRAEQAKVRIRLSRTGRRLLQHTRRVKLTARGTYAASDRTSITASLPVALSR